MISEAAKQLLPSVSVWIYRIMEQPSLALHHQRQQRKDCNIYYACFHATSIALVAIGVFIRNIKEYLCSLRYVFSDKLISSKTT